MTAPPLDKPITAPVGAVEPGALELGAVDLRGRPVAGAQCRFDPELHTGPYGYEPPDERAARELVAVQVCQSCPLRAECFELAMRFRPETGVWAGFTAAELAIDVQPALSDFDLNEVA
ncbi:WhiB family transcriptional regulator [Actinomadura sp. KC216]|uniref:WhiB family transcriptional regulator n=1 Tax=Actinomadura sp. KC216 TaxID=2530370 RepID=UPI00104AB6D1|nr:WhiB family transcriptional regulator [Actinomadura sp. KC216]TDB76059.1 WhiB family transcriptional regulator [Actinomadura sp. KC216]